MPTVGGEVYCEEANRIRRGKPLAASWRMSSSPDRKNAARLPRLGGGLVKTDGSNAIATTLSRWHRIAVATLVCFRGFLVQKFDYKGRIE